MINFFRTEEDFNCIPGISPPLDMGDGPVDMMQDFFSFGLFLPVLMHRNIVDFYKLDFISHWKAALRISSG